MIIPDRRFDEPEYAAGLWSQSESLALAAFRALRLREELEPRATPGDVVLVAPSGRGSLPRELRADGFEVLAAESSRAILRDQKNTGLVFPWTLPELAEKKIDFAVLIGRPERFENLLSAVDFFIERCEKAVIVSMERSVSIGLLSRFTRLSVGSGAVLMKWSAKYEKRREEK